MEKKKSLVFILHTSAHFPKIKRIFVAARAPEQAHYKYTLV